MWQEPLTREPLPVHLTAGGQRAPDCSVQVAVGFRDDADGAPSSQSAWLNATGDGVASAPLAWRFENLRNGWLLLTTLMDDSSDLSLANVVLTSDSGQSQATLEIPSSTDCATQLEPPDVFSVAALNVAGAAFVPLLVTLSFGVPGSITLVSIDGAADAPYSGPFIVPSCADTPVTAHVTKPGAVDSPTVTVLLTPIVGATPLGDAAATCVSVARRAASTGAMAFLALGAGGGGRGADCDVQLVVQYAPSALPPGGVAAFRIERTDVDDGSGGVTVVAAAGYDTVLSLGAVPGAPSYILYEATAGGGWTRVAAPPVTVGLQCLGIAAAPEVLVLDAARPSSAVVVVSIVTGYVAAVSATTFVTTDGTDPSIAGGSRIWFTGLESWNMTLQVRGLIRLVECFSNSCAGCALRFSHSHCHVAYSVPHAGTTVQCRRHLPGDTLCDGARIDRSARTGVVSCSFTHCVHGELDASM